MKTLVTGATGLIGTALLSRMAGDGGFAARAATRRLTEAHSAGGVDWVPGSDLSEGGDWARALDGIEAVVHLAARVHIMRESASDPLSEFRRVNVEGTLRLARQAADAGVRRFVYLSSVKVNGESGAYAEADLPRPEDAYGISKHEAEQGLLRIATGSNMNVVIIRPPLVYGPGVRANFRTLIRAVASGVPLPFGAIHNRRSLVASDNLADFILTCLAHPTAANEVFMVSDGEDLSTTDLIRRLAGAMGLPARLIPIPASILMAVAAVAGKRDVARRVLESLQVDISKARTLLSWAPPISVDEGLRRTVTSQ